MLALIAVLAALVAQAFAVRSLRIYRHDVAPVFTALARKESP